MDIHVSLKMKELEIESQKFYDMFLLNENEFQFRLLKQHMQQRMKWFVQSFEISENSIVKFKLKKNSSYFEEFLLSKIYT